MASTFITSPRHLEELEADFNPLTVLHSIQGKLVGELHDLEDGSRGNRQLVSMKTELLPGVVLELGHCNTYMQAVQESIKTVQEYTTEIVVKIMKLLNQEMTDTEHKEKASIGMETLEVCDALSDQLMQFKDLLYELTEKATSSVSAAQDDVKTISAQLPDDVPQQEVTPAVAQSKSDVPESPKPTKVEEPVVDYVKKPLKEKPLKSTEEKIPIHTETKLPRVPDNTNLNKWKELMYPLEKQDESYKSQLIKPAKENPLPLVTCIIHVAEDSQLESRNFKCYTLLRDDSSLEIGENEELTSYIVSVTCDIPKDEQNEVVRIAVPCIPPKKDSHNITGLRVRSAKKWTDLSSCDIITNNDFPNCKFIMYEVRQFDKISLAAVSKLRESKATLGIAGGQVVSTVDGRVSVTVPPHALQTDSDISLKVQAVDQATLSDVKKHIPDCLVSVSPLVHLQASVHPITAITVTLPPPALAPRPKKVRGRYTEAQKSLLSETVGEDSVVVAVRTAANTWCILPDISFNKERTDLLMFSLDQPVNRILILRVKDQSKQSVDVASVASTVEQYVRQKRVNFVFRQKSDDPCDVIIDCVGSDKKDTILDFYDHNGYVDGPDSSNDINISEGQLIRVRFSTEPHKNNLQYVDGQGVQFYYDSLLEECARHCHIAEIDRYAQKSRDFYRGIVQFIAEGSPPGVSVVSHDNHHPLIRKDSLIGMKGVLRKDTDSEMKAAWSDTGPQHCDTSPAVVYSVSVTIPKPPPQDPIPLKKIPVQDLFLRQSMGVLDHDSLDKLSKALGEEWRDVLDLIGVSHSKIEQIKRQNYQASDAGTLFYEAILLWFKATFKSTDKVRILCNALVHCGRGDLAHEILEREDELQQLEKKRIEDQKLQNAFSMIIKSEDIVNNWRDLVKELKLRDTEIADVGHTGSTAADKCLLSLQNWLNAPGRHASLKRLIRALKRSKHPVIAESIKNHFGLK